jgi:cytochrome c553
VAPLAGQRDIARRLRELREARTPQSVMPQIARGLTDAEIDALAAYFGARSAAK